jgi:D-tyrosyl-tRNA(Tyr) deacylase
LRAVVQRVSSGRVTVEGKAVGEIGCGLVVLLGVAAGDSEADARQMAERTVHLRIFKDEQGRLNRSVLEAGGAVLAVSNFTVCGDARGGRRPSFIGAARPDAGERLYERYLEFLRAAGVTVAGGVFGADMLVEIANDGPVTILLDSKKTF